MAPVFAAPYQPDVPVTNAADVRSPVRGDPGEQAATPHMTAAQLSRADRQGPGTENGNQPDRAEAGGGAR